MLKYFTVLLIIIGIASSTVTDYCNNFVADDGTNWSNPWAGVY